MPLLALLILLLLPEWVLAQGLPSLRPINPVAASRSGVSFEPFRDPRPGRWVADVGLEYASTIEYDGLPEASFLLDSELLRVRATVSRDLSPKTFVLAEAELLGAYDGIFDGLLEWYHDLLGIEIPERERRPRNDFLYAADLAGRGPLLREPEDLFLGDVRLGVGLRVHPRVQSLVALTLPTNTGPAGYGRGEVSASLLNTARLPLTPRLVFEGSLSGGYTPSHGPLTGWQRELFLAGSSGLRWRFWGRQSLYGNLFLHSPYYHDTALLALDRRDLSFDFGWILAGNGGRELRVGMTEDLEPGGPAVDLVFRVGGRFPLSP
ncbi:MAG TPA: DUF3187 family protein [Gemmatimonadales bacterium]|nr:DUF3187 family protein [Gemmatimonadales bacterium]